MFEKRQKLKKLLKEFQKICKENNLWYCADGTTLLGAIRHYGFVPWEGKIELMITHESFATLKRLYSQNFFDLSEIKGSRKKHIVFVKDIKDLKSPQIFIKLRILVPTTVVKIMWYRSYINWLINFLKFRSRNLRNSINDLKDDNFQGYLLLDNKNQDIIQTWIQVLSFETQNKKLNEINIPVPIEYETILKRWYANYKKTITPKYRKFYISPLVTKKERF